MNNTCPVPLFMSRSVMVYKEPTLPFSVSSIMAVVVYFTILQIMIYRSRIRPQAVQVEEVTDVPEVEEEEEEEDEDTEDPEDDQWLFTGRYLELPGMIVLLTSCNGSWRFQLKDTYYYLTQEMVDTLSKQLVKSKD